MKLKILLCCVFLAAMCDVHAQRLSRDVDVSLLTNQVGYLPSSSKTCVLKTSSNTSFEVIEVTSGKIVYSGTLKPTDSDFGTYAVADFSKVVKEGHYYLRADTVRSYPFIISSRVYQSPMNNVVNYFSKQRCGASTTGYLTPCHTDDGLRFDNGRHQDVSGGWHDASDLRKWVSATIYGVMGLARAYDLEDAQFHKTILDEIRWGNQYFLKMQEPAGYVMDFVGGDLKQHSDNNRWTDNIYGQQGTDIKLVKPNAGTSQSMTLAAKEYDDRIIQTQPVEMSAQYNFITSEAMVARIASATDRVYSKKCLDAAERCYAWAKKLHADSNTINAGAALQASLELYKTTKKDSYRQRAAEIANTLKKLQASGNDAVSGFFTVSLKNKEPYKNIWNGCQAFIGLCDMVAMFPSDSHVAEWKTMIRNYADKYLMKISSKNSFGIVPWGLYENADPGGDRKIGNYWYRYFMQPEDEWWVGINSNIASAGIGLLKASVVLKDERFRAAAQKQLDWIFGFNPYNSSTMLGVGYNHPRHFAGSSFLPTVPLIDGAVVNGLGGDHSDLPVIGNGDWQVSEYWTPMVAYTLWLMAELSAK